MSNREERISTESPEKTIPSPYQPTDQLLEINQENEEEEEEEEPFSLIKSQVHEINQPEVAFIAEHMPFDQMPFEQMHTEGNATERTESYIENFGELEGSNGNL